MSTHDFLSIHHVAQELGIAEPTVRTAIRKGRLPSIKIDGYIMVARVEVDAYRKRTQSEGGSRRGRPRSLSATGRESLLATDLTDIEIERAKLFRDLVDHDQQAIDHTVRTLQALKSGGISYKMNIIIHVGAGQMEGSGAVQIVTRSDEKLSTVDKLINDTLPEYNFHDIAADDTRP